MTGSAPKRRLEPGAALSQGQSAVPLAFTVSDFVKEGNRANMAGPRTGVGVNEIPVSGCPLHECLFRVQGPKETKRRSNDRSRNERSMNFQNVTLSSIDSYASACADLSSTVSRLKSEGYDLIVIPSRGASPFYNASKSFEYAINSEAATPFSTSPILSRTETLYLPFTADSSDDTEVSSLQIRKYWAKVLAAIISRDSADAALRFYRFLRAQAGELALGAAEVRGCLEGKFMFIDTVVSGRAICDISQALNDLGMDQCHYILFVDKRGEDLTSENRKIIQSLEYCGRATVIYVDSIFTEDEGPSLSGIWSVTFPDIMLTAKQHIEAFSSCIGAGLYYHEIKKRPNGSNRNITKSNAILSTLLHCAVRSQFDSAERFLEELKRHVKGENLQDQKQTLAVAAPLITDNLNFDVELSPSGSHVIRARNIGPDADAFIKKFIEIGGNK